MIAAVPLGVYVIVQVTLLIERLKLNSVLTSQNFNLPIQIQPQIFCVFALVSWTQILMYNK